MPVTRIANSGRRGARICGLGAVLPSSVVTNDDLADRLATSDDWIYSRTGIRERRVGGSSTEWGTLAAREALREAGFEPEDIDLLLLSTTSPDRLVPSTASLVHAELGLQCGALDLNAACAGFVYGLVLAHGHVAMGADRVLLVAGETPSRLVEGSDRAVAVLAGDGGGAMALEATAEESPLLGWDLGCDGTAADILTCEHGGSLEMRGGEVFRRAVRASLESIRAAMERAKVTAADIDLFVPHQANGRIIEAIRGALGIAEERTVVTVDHHANTSSASVPLALAEARDHGRLHEGDLVLMSGFGAGMSWASAVTRWE